MPSIRQIAAYPLDATASPRPVSPAVVQRSQRGRLHLAVLLYACSQQNSSLFRSHSVHAADCPAVHAPGAVHEAWNSTNLPTCNPQQQLRRGCELTALQCLAQVLDQHVDCSSVTLALLCLPKSALRGGSPVGEVPRTQSLFRMGNGA